MLRNTFPALWMGLVIAGTSQATVILQTTPTPLAAGGLTQWQVSAVSNVGEVIYAFSQPSITPVGSGAGAHQIFQAFTTGQTPTETEHAAGMWNPAWAAYDTYYKFGSIDHALSFGTYTETNDGPTSGTLGLPAMGNAPNNPRSGFGTVSSTADNSQILTLANSSSNVNFYQIVLKNNEAANLTVRVVPVVGGVYQFNNFQVGGGGGTPAINIVEIILNDRELSAGPISQQLDDGPADPAATWSNLVLNNGEPANAPSLSSSGLFTWNPAGSKAGPKGNGVLYRWTATATNITGADTDFAITVRLIPEPATTNLAGLAMVAVVGLIRRRS